MTLFYYAIMISGALALSFGFYALGERKLWDGWGGVILMFAGLITTFLGVLLAFAPRFFS